jgi:hypothetical protein
MLEMHVDNETLDVKPTAVVLTVGAVMVEGDEIIKDIYFALDIQEQLNLGRTISGSTIAWWMQQSADAIKPLFDAPKLTIGEARAVVRGHAYKCERIWARPGMFDLVMLRDLLGADIWDNLGEKRFGRGYQKEADMQGLVLEFDPRRALAPAFEGVPHHALHDARHHHRWLQAIRKRQAEMKAAYDAANPFPTPQGL